MNQRIRVTNLEELEICAKIAEHAAELTWLKPQEAACYMNVSESTLWRLLSKGMIPPSKDGGTVRIARSDINVYWTQRKRMGVLKQHADPQTES